MATPNRPPNDITPKDFFESWLPAEYQRLARELSTSPPDATVCVELDGEGGGAWTLTLSGGALEVAGERAGSASIRIKQSVADWRLITVGAGDQSLPTTASIDKLLTSPALRQMLDTVKGTLRFEIPGLEGRDFATEVTFQDAGEPHATISVDAETLEQIRTGALPAPQAFFAGKIQMSGDTAFAMQVGMAAMAPPGS